MGVPDAGIGAAFLALEQPSRREIIRLSRRPAPIARTSLAASIRRRG